MKLKRAGGTSGTLVTILWVLAAIAILSALLGGAYFLMHNGAAKHTQTTTAQSQSMWGK